MICISWWVISLKELYWKQECVESSVISYVNEPRYLYSCLQSPRLATSQTPVNVRCRQNPSLPCFSFQFWLVMHYLSEMTEEQTLVMYSGHPLGLFPSHQRAPRLVITNGMVGISILFSFSSNSVSILSVGWVKIWFILSEFTTTHRRIWGPNSAAFFSSTAAVTSHVLICRDGEKTFSLLENLCSYRVGSTFLPPTVQLRSVWKI